MISDYPSRRVGESFTNPSLGKDLIGDLEMGMKLGSGRELGSSAVGELIDDNNNYGIQKMNVVDEELEPECVDKREVAEEEEEDTYQERRP